MAKKYKIKINAIKSVHVTFTIRKEVCPPITLNDLRVFQAEGVKYLGLHVDCRLNCKKYIYIKRKELGFQLGKMY